VSEERARLLRVVLPPDPTGRPREAFLILTPHAEPKAFLNLCPHLDVPLDAGSADYAARGGELICRTHGARFRVQDGVCTWGPCLGDALETLDAGRDADGLWLRFEGATLRVD